VVTPPTDRFIPGKETRYPFYRRLVGPQGRSGRVQKISPPPRFDPRAVQPVVSRYTDCVIPNPVYCPVQIKVTSAFFNDRIGCYVTHLR